MSNYSVLKAKRTDAVAPRSLFGTIAEIKDEETRREVKDLKTLPKPTKPDKLARYKRSDADDIIRSVEDQYKNQKCVASEAHGKLQAAQVKALNFQPDSNTVRLADPKRGRIDRHKKSGTSPCNENEIMPHQSRDALTEEYGRLGIDLQNDTSSCHHFKDSPSNEKYQMMGNALGKGGKFSNKGKEYATLGTHSISGSSSKSSVRTTPRPPSVPIPANLRHKYGDNVCSGVLEDAQLLIHEGITSPAHSKSTPTRSKSGTPTSTAGRPDSTKIEADTLYDGLSNALRQDIFNGVSYSHLKSLNTSSYSADRAKLTTETYPPKFAVCRNEDSKWNEDMVIYQKLMKEWDAVMAERSKPSE